MSQQDCIAIVGAAHAGGRAAQALRASGFDGRILLYGEENWEPYERPPLSKALLLGEGGHDEVRLLPHDWYAQNRIELRLGTRVTGIDADTRQLRFEGGVESWDRLILTTGARPRALPVPGGGLQGVRVLRTLDDSLTLRGALKPGSNVVVAGGGFIGLECAASARKRGCTVSVVEVADRLMGRAVAPEIGEWFTALHRRHGTDIRLGARIERLEGHGRVERVVLADGSSIPAETVIVGIGIQPNVELAEGAGLASDNGILVDEFGRTGNPLIWAAGDCASQPNARTGRRLRLESYQNAQDQGLAVGRNILAAEPKSHEDRLWVWSDQYDVNLQMLGVATGWSRIVYRGDPVSGEGFIAFYLDEKDRLVAINTVNAGREMRSCERLFAHRGPVDPARLQDPAENLRKIVG